MDAEEFSSSYSTDGEFSVRGASGRGRDALECFYPKAEPAEAESLGRCGSRKESLLKVFDGRANLLLESLTALEFPFPACSVRRLP